MGLTKRIIIELTPAAIDGALLSNGRVARTAHVAIDNTDWRQAWEEGLSPLDTPLEELLQSLGAPGVDATVLYRSPTSFAEVLTVPVTGSAVGGAVNLALADHLGFCLQQNPSSIQPLGTTKQGETKSTHVLAIADAASASAALHGWLDRQGHRLVGACPSSALTLADAVDEASQQRSDEVAARLYFDRYCSLLTVSSGGSVRLVRRIEIGFEDFASAISNPIHQRDGDQGPITLAPGKARALLCEHGIAGFDDTIDQGLGLRGKDTLPLIQPALQRLGIEIKQSLRFELSQEERESIKLTCSGPFGGMPNITSAICEQTEITASGVGAAKPDPESAEAPFFGVSNRPVDLAKLARNHNILGDSIASGLRTEALRFGLRAGAVAAVVAIGATAFFTNTQIQKERESTRSLGAAMETVDEIVAMNESILLRGQSLSATHQRMHSTIGTSMRWSDVLSTLPGLIPDAVTVVDLEGVEHTASAPAKIELAGIAKETGEQTSQESLSSFIESLNGCPLVDSVVLGSTNRVGGTEEAEALRFGVVVHLVTTPRLVISSAEEGADQ